MTSKRIMTTDAQFDYFSENYHQFERDFYAVSNLAIPLTFLSEDILRMMAQGQKHYFKLNRTNAKDFKDHYFVFRVETLHETPHVRVYKYVGHTTKSDT
ncbi:DUF5960 family protein [Atopobacter phocae]|uniref:DUF5960 family protein n=1 Tax=Atopobacter phocae TaxID=136492 RepID=UPI000471013F|nr:DUF5960 family protein [Atopobacter phocae]